MPTATATRTPRQIQFERAARLGIDTLNEHYGINVPYPVVRWTLSGRGTLGKVVSVQNTITGRITCKYIALHKGYAATMGAAYVETVLHEVCHVVTNHRMAMAGNCRTGRWSSHGAEWATAMRVLGLRPDRLANVPAATVAAASTPRKTTRVKVSCTCGEYMLTPQIATAITSPGIHCKTCRSRFWRMK